MHKDTHTHRGGRKERQKVDLTKKEKESKRNVQRHKERE